MLLDVARCYSPSNKLAYTQHTLFFLFARCVVQVSSFPPQEEEKKPSTFAKNVLRIYLLRIAQHFFSSTSFIFLEPKNQQQQYKEKSFFPLLVRIKVPPSQALEEEEEKWQSHEELLQASTEMIDVRRC